MNITIENARNIIVGAQKLRANTSTLDVIKHLGYVQIDTISVVERAHHHTLWARNNRYQRSELNQLLESRKLIEYWAHAASYLPIEQYRYVLPRMLEYRSNKSHWFKVDPKIKSYVIDRIKSEGPLKASDFETLKKSSGWFDWKPAKKALEQHFMSGTLMVLKRDGFQKVYDISERVLPNVANLTPATNEEVAENLILVQLRNMGLATISEISYLRSPVVKKGVEKAALKLKKSGRIEEIEIQNERYLKLVETPKVIDISDQIHILSPFDNLVIQRKRIKKLFMFDYQVECYVPGNKRRFGYFCLPILQGNQFIGRVDAKAHRQEGKFEIKNIFFEQGIKPTGKLKQDIHQSLQEFAHFNQCPTLIRARPSMVSQN